MPANSVIHRLFYAEPQASGEDNEDMSQWESQGRVKSRAVVVEGRKVAERSDCYRPVSVGSEGERNHEVTDFLGD